MFTQKLSMDCTQEQYEKYLKEELEKMGYKRVDDFNSMPFNGVLTGWNDDYIIQSYNKGGIENDSRTYLGKFNAPLFLALAAMTDKEFGGYKEYWTDGEHWILSDGKWTVFYFSWRKASVSEIMAKFGEQPKKDIYITLAFEKEPIWENCEKLIDEYEAVHLLKSKGYRIFKQTTTLEEV